MATLTDLPGDPVKLECLHRARANAEDRVRAAKQTGLENLPFRNFDHNAVWLELSLIAQDLTARTQRLALEDELAVCEPKTLRYRLLHTAGRPASHARRATLRLPRNWPWAEALAAAFTRLAALPPPAHRTRRAKPRRSPPHPHRPPTRPRPRHALYARHNQLNRDPSTRNQPPGPAPDSHLTQPGPNQHNT